MNIEEYRDYCLSKSMVTESTPFDEVTLVFKVNGKMFSLTGMDTFSRINLKCDPDRAVELREEYPAILPGYHMSKKHWNSLMLDGSLSDELIYSLTDDSYDLVVSSFSKAQQAIIRNGSAQD